MPAISEKLREIISIELQIDQELVRPDASLLKLGMDSVSALNIIYAIEEAFGIAAIDVNEIVKIETVADVETLLRRYLPQANE